MATIALLLCHKYPVQQQVGMWLLVQQPSAHLYTCVLVLSCPFGRLRPMMAMYTAILSMLLVMVESMKVKTVTTVVWEA